MRIGRRQKEAVGTVSGVHAYHACGPGFEPLNLINQTHIPIISTLRGDSRPFFGAPRDSASKAKAKVWKPWKVRQRGLG